MAVPRHNRNFVCIYCDSSIMGKQLSCNKQWCGRVEILWVGCCKSCGCVWEISAQSGNFLCHVTWFWIFEISFLATAHWILIRFGHQMAQKIAKSLNYKLEYNISRDVTNGFHFQQESLECSKNQKIWKYGFWLKIKINSNTLYWCRAGDHVTYDFHMNCHYN